LIKEDSVKIKELITIEEANVYLCGNLEMGKEVTSIKKNNKKTESKLMI